MSLEILEYKYTHTVTEATTGYFSCEPQGVENFDAALARLEAAPMDDFLHQHLLRRLGAASLEQLRSRLPEALGTDGTPGRPVLAALLLECAMLNAAQAPLADAFPPNAAEELARHTPLIPLRWSRLADGPAHRAWSAVFAANLSGHHVLPRPDEEEMPPLYTPELSTAEGDVPSIADIHARLAATPGAPRERPPAQETAARALELLVDNGIVAGVEMRHEASLSPIALLRPWNLDIAVRNGSLNYTLRGQATAYGRGLSVAEARASYAMEMVERASAYATVEKGAVVGLTRAAPLIRARYSELTAQGRAALDPNELPLEVPYADQPLHWLEARAAGDGACVLAPAQAVYLFCNLDEQALQSAAGSTGLASGNTLEEAKAAALTEILERDAEATMPYHRSRCFTLRCRDKRLQSLLDDYAARGIHVQFQDLTTEFGVPCYQCFVLGPKGQVARGTGAGLCGPRAALAALTETPYPYPNGGPSGPGLRGLPERILEELPDYRLESPARNLQLLEMLLAEHGRRPLYVELTREDLEFPVVRAIVPGLELTAEPDGFSRIRPRLFRNYLKLFVEQELVHK